MWITFEKNIPIPPVRRSGRKGKRIKRINWAQMKLMDSFYLEGLTAFEAHRKINGGRLRGYSFAVRADGSGARVWRIA